jgi:hypothetical protein
MVVAGEQDRSHPAGLRCAANDPPRFRPQSAGSNAAQLRSTHRMKATLRLVTAMLGLGLLTESGSATLGRTSIPQFIYAL